MAHTTPSNFGPIQQLVENWAAAVEAVLEDIDRIAKGGQSDPAATSTLVASAEAARRQCEEALLQ